MRMPRRLSVALGCGTWAVGLCISVESQVATFSSKREAVRIDALVTENRRVVQGLQPADFEVRDNGVLQQVDLASFEQLPLDVILALDASDSVFGERLQHLRAAGRAVLDALAADDRAALITFSHLVAVREPLSGDATRIRRALDELAPHGQTSLVDGVYAAMTLTDTGSASRDLVIVFSDGHDTLSWLQADQVLESARRSAATVYGVSVRGSSRSDFLPDLSALTGGSVIEVESTRDLSATFIRILDEFRQRYVISYSPRGVARDGWHRLQVRVKGRRVDVSARAGYFAGP